jgi:hypothetical protein
VLRNFPTKPIRFAIALAAASLCAAAAVIAYLHAGDLLGVEPDRAAIAEADEWLAAESAAPPSIPRSSSPVKPRRNNASAVERAMGADRKLLPFSRNGRFREHEPVISMAPNADAQERSSDPVADEPIKPELTDGQFTAPRRRATANVAGAHSKNSDRIERQERLPSAIARPERLPAASTADSRIESAVPPAVRHPAAGVAVPMTEEGEAPRSSLLSTAAAPASRKWPRGNFTPEEERERAQYGWQAFADAVFAEAIGTGAR